MYYINKKSLFHSIMKASSQQRQMLDSNLDEKDRPIMGCNVTMIDLSYTLLPKKIERGILVSKQFFFSFKSTNLCVYKYVQGREPTVILSLYYNSVPK